MPRTLVASTVEPLAHLAEQGLGLAFRPGYLIGRGLIEGRHVSVLSGLIQHRGILRIVWPASRYVSPKVRASVDYLSHNLSQDLLDVTNAVRDPA